MGRVSIEVEGDKTKSADEVDPLGVAAAYLLADLFPGVTVTVRYRREQEDSSIPGVISVRSRTVNVPGLLRSSFIPLPREDGWWRDLKLVMTDGARHFLGLGSDDALYITHRRPKTAWRRDVPSELKYAPAICEDVSRAWTRDLTEKPTPETIIALRNQLPLWAICHIAADLHYSFATYKSGKGKHDLVATTLANTVMFLENLASTRVEHEELSHGVVVAKPSRSARPLERATYPESFLALKRTPLLSDGIRAALWVSPEGRPIGLITSDELRRRKRREKDQRNPFASLSFLAEASAVMAGLAVALRQDGSIIIFGHGRPLFVRRGSRWRGMLWSSVREALDHYFGDVGRIVFDTALILSTTGHGGILGVVDQEPEGIHDKDRVPLARDTIARDDTIFSHREWLFHTLLPATDVSQLGSETLAMLAAIDGATILTRSGTLLAYGAVVPSRSAGSEGARSAAARQLSEHGLVVKISADGPIALYQGGAEIIEV